MHFCFLGQFDPDTGEIIPNGKVGRPGRTAKTSTEKPQAVPVKKAEQETDIAALILRLSKMEETLLMLSEEIHGIRDEIQPNHIRYLTGS